MKSRVHSNGFVKVIMKVCRSFQHVQGLLHAAGDDHPVDPERSPGRGYEM